MASNRRDFLRNTIIGTGALASGLAGQVSASEEPGFRPKTNNPGQQFNMSGYAAPKLGKVRIGFVGLGNRGPGAVERMSYIEGVEIIALCDVQSDRVEKCQKILDKHGLPRAKSYSGSKEIFYKEFTGHPFRGNMNTTFVRTYKGKTILIQHDVTSPRPYSRIHQVSGTKGIACKYPEPVRIATAHEWLKEDEMKQLEEQYTPEIVKRIGEMAKQIGGHGGMDFMMDWRLIDCLRNGLPLDENVYDAALWSSIAPLSAMSLNNRSNSVDVPNFTNGAWKTNAPVELTLKGGGTTGVKVIRK